jgi:hypothetical protein
MAPAGSGLTAMLFVILAAQASHRYRDGVVIHDYADQIRVHLHVGKPNRGQDKRLKQARDSKADVCRLHVDSVAQFLDAHVILPGGILLSDRVSDAPAVLMAAIAVLIVPSSAHTHSSIVF